MDNKLINTPDLVRDKFNNLNKRFGLVKAREIMIKENNITI